MVSFAPCEGVFLVKAHDTVCATDCCSLSCGVGLEGSLHCCLGGCYLSLSRRDSLVQMGSHSPFVSFISKPHTLLCHARTSVLFLFTATKCSVTKTGECIQTENEQQCISCKWSLLSVFGYRTGRIVVFWAELNVYWI